MLDFHSYWAKVQGLDIHYKCQGKGEPVILLHGAANDWHEWEKNIDALSHSFRIYVPDLPGYGLSQMPEVPIASNWGADFLDGFVKAIGIPSAHLVGHSMGGMGAIAFALEHPDRVKKLILVNSGGLGDLSRRGKFILRLASGIRKLAGKERKFTYAESTADDWVFRDRLPELKPQTMIVWGDKDIYLPVSQAKQAHSLIPDCRLHIFPRCGHAPQREYTEEFNNLVRQFLNE
jgi:pimeloyl-ACP methyl ester carboxylesterase